MVSYVVFFFSIAEVASASLRCHLGERGSYDLVITDSTISGNNETQLTISLQQLIEPVNSFSPIYIALLVCCLLAILWFVVSVFLYPRFCVRPLRACLSAVMDAEAARYVMGSEQQLDSTSSSSGAGCSFAFLSHAYPLTACRFCGKS